MDAGGCNARRKYDILFHGQFGGKFMELKITCIPGDGIGPEVVEQAVIVVEVLDECLATSSVEHEGRAAALGRNCLEHEGNLSTCLLIDRDACGRNSHVTIGN